MRRRDLCESQAILPLGMHIKDRARQHGNKEQIDVPHAEE